MHTRTPQRITDAVIAASALFGLVIMFMAVTAGKTGDAWRTVAVGYFFYFTIITNIIVFLFFTAKVFMQKDRSRLDAGTMNGAVTLSIAMTGIVFFLLLRDNFKSTGIAFTIGNIFLHYIVPAACILYWAVFTRTTEHRLSHIPLWLIYPAAYLVMTLVRGLFTHTYPYPFFDVTARGYAAVLITGGILLAAFFVLGLILVGVSALFRRKSR